MAIGMIGGALLGAGLNIVANGIGTAIANKRKREAEEAYKKTIDKEIADIDAELNSNYLDRADAQNALRKMTDAKTETLRQLNTEAIRGGATDEAKVAMANKLTRNVASLTGDLAAAGERHKDALRGQKRNLRLGMAGHTYQQNADTSGIETIMASVGSAANSIASAWGTANTTPTADTTTTKSYSNAFSGGGDYAPSLMTSGDQMAARQMDANEDYYRAGK
jgi:hypothetical protein